MLSFFFNDTATTEIYTLSLHDALPICIRAHLDDRSETLNYRIREGEVGKVPYMAIIGQREAESDSLALRVRGAGKKQDVMTAEAFLARVTEEARTRALPRLPAPA